MITKIFASREAFDKRDDPRVNGVDAVFDYTHMAWDMDCGNEGCWNCIACVECKNCSYCVRCEKCNDCSHCEDLLYGNGVKPRESQAPKRVKYVCSNCGSDHILWDAYAEWCVDTQKLVLSTTYDHKECGACNSTRINEIETETETPDTVPDIPTEEADSPEGH